MQLLSGRICIFTRTNRSKYYQPLSKVRFVTEQWCILLIVKAVYSLHNDVLMDARRLNCNDKKGCCGLIRLRTDFQE